MLRPIPRNLLPDTITVQVPYDGEWGGEYAEPVEIAHVRYDSSVAVLRNAYQFEDGSQGLIYVDAANSEGAFAIPAGSLITLNGEKLSVVKSTQYEDYNGHIHHWEVEVR